MQLVKIHDPLSYFYVMSVTKEMVLSYSVLIFLSLLNLEACVSTPEPMKAKADFTGFITDIQSNERSDSKWLSAESHADKLIHRCQIEVTSKTAIYRWDGNQEIPISFDNIVIKDKIKAWFYYSAEKPYPSKGKAQKIIVATAIPLTNAD